jgi:membrane associated rhomboid family serine protease
MQIAAAPPRLQRLPWFTIGCSLAALATHFLPDLASLLEYQRAAIGSGQLWRLVTCHLTHFGGEHLFWDLLVFLALGTYVELRGRGSWLVGVAGASVLIPVTLLVVQPALLTYRGLSGLDTALFALLAASWVVRDTRTGMEQAAEVPAGPPSRRNRRGEGQVARGKFLSAARLRPHACVGTLLLLALVGKTLFEVLAGQCLFVDNVQDRFTPVPMAHLTGAVIGIGTAWITSVSWLRSTGFWLGSNGPSRHSRWACCPVRLPPSST